MLLQCHKQIFKLFFNILMDNYIYTLQIWYIVECIFLMDFIKLLNCVII